MILLGLTLGENMKAIVLALCALMMSGCYVVDFFSDDSAEKSSDGGGAVIGSVIGRSLGGRAGGADEAALSAIRSISTSHPPAAVRPDPDLYLKRMLRQYRPEGEVLARLVGKMQPYRLLLGGASQDFAKAPQESYDATSMLAVAKVAEEACWALVAPYASEHADWQTILPFKSDQETENLAWLAARMLGRPEEVIATENIEELLEIMRLEEPYMAAVAGSRNNNFAKYVPACTTLALDAEAMFL
jgi:hypothetical protein